jgi:hypothetical protein
MALDPAFEKINRNPNGPMPVIGYIIPPEDTGEHATFWVNITFHVFAIPAIRTSL